VVTTGTPERVIVQLNVLDVKFAGIAELVCDIEFVVCELDVPSGLTLPLLFFFDPITAPTITARRAKKPMIMIIIPLFVR
jgi:hypothetical protein